MGQNPRSTTDLDSRGKQVRHCCKTEDCELSRPKTFPRNDSGGQSFARSIQIGLSVKGSGYMFQLRIKEFEVSERNYLQLCATQLVLSGMKRLSPLIIRATGEPTSYSARFRAKQVQHCRKAAGWNWKKLLLRDSSRFLLMQNPVTQME
jgi:hypothetical protein